MSGIKERLGKLREIDRATDALLNEYRGLHTMIKQGYARKYIMETCSEIEKLEQTLTNANRA